MQYPLFVSCRLSVVSCHWEEIFPHFLHFLHFPHFLHFLHFLHFPNPQSPIINPKKDAAESL
ncbi:MAG: hypothetical protein HEP80_08060 [Dolichospermum sp. UKL201]|nr:MAG: hypothetical protein HEP80_08060 [Dolichospermum sp. UKL201]